MRTPCRESGNKIASEKMINDQDKDDVMSISQICPQTNQTISLLNHRAIESVKFVLMSNPIFLEGEGEGERG